MTDADRKVTGTRRLVGMAAIAGGVLLPLAAFAHAGHGGDDTWAGVLHPLTGLDHLLAMLAVGLWAGQLGRTSAWVLPATFPLAMMLGAALAFAGVALPAVEPGIVATAVVLGVAVALRWRPATAACVALAGAFALLHGHAHGAELPAGADPVGYGLGFSVATIGLHLLGMALGHAGRRGALAGRLVQAGGSAIAAAALAAGLA